MPPFIAMMPVGIILIVLGVLNMKGNISSLHSYHRQRVRPEDVLPLGRKVGLGNILCGVGALLFGIFFLIFDLSGLDLFVWIGTALLLAGLGVGLFISLRAIIKYNKGLF